MMIEHSKSVRKGVKKSLMIVDMPFDTYKNKSQALKNCKKVLKETKCDGIKLEGGRELNNIIKYLINNKIPVMGHIGITPQTTRGKYRYKGRTAFEKKKLLKDSKSLDSGGQIVALGINDGKFIWKTFLDSFPISAHLVGQGRLLVATKSGKLYFLNKSSGFPTHNVASGFSLGAPPALGHNQLVVVDKSGIIKSLK